jgi:hypothetical protein
MPTLDSNREILAAIALKRRLVKLTAIEFKSDVIFDYQVDRLEIAHTHLAPHRPTATHEPYSRDAFEHALGARIDPVT